MVALPLIFASLVPGIELDLFTSTVPLTGVSLLLRSLMLEKYDEARQFFLARCYDHFAAQFIGH